MQFNKLQLDGTCLITPDVHPDDRGSFARVFCSREFEENDLESNFVQYNISSNLKAGTLRGMHYQLPPHQEIKLVRCTRGKIFDVIVDIRHDSPTRGQWLANELSESNQQSLYIPEGFAHGFMSLSDNSEVFYQMSTFFEPGSARIMRWDNPVAAIEWPYEPLLMSEKDRNATDDPWQTCDRK